MTGRSPTRSAEQRFGALVDHLRGRPGVTVPAETGPGPARFGEGGLKVRGRLFAMLVRGDLVVKLPAARVTQMVGDHLGTPFTAGKSGPGMKEWLVLARKSRLDWSDLAEESLAFVDGPRR